MPSKVSIAKAWKVIPGFPDYEINRITTQVRRATAGHCTYAGKILKQCDKPYFSVTFTLPGSRRAYFRVHVLMLLTFRGPKPTPKHEGAHNDGNKLNNQLWNLRWATRKNNAADRLTHGTENRGERNGQAKLTECDVICIKRALQKNTRGQAARLGKQYGVNRSLISMIKTGIRWGHIVLDKRKAR